MHDDAETIAEFAKSYHNVKVLCPEPEQMLLGHHLETKLKEYYKVAEAYVSSEQDPVKKARCARSIRLLINSKPISGKNADNFWLEAHEINIPNFWDLMLRLLCLRTLILSLLDEKEP